LTQNSQFSYVYKHAKRWHSDGVVLFFKKGSEKKVGFIASKKVGNAVKRARAKRRMRALFFDNQESLIDGIYLIVAKDRINQMNYDELEKGIKWSFKRLECLKS